MKPTVSDVARLDWARPPLVPVRAVLSHRLTLA
jgi:hypothetical protein